jgi:c-di-GMP-binding flagellar brake protein YcgR
VTAKPPPFVEKRKHPRIPLKLSADIDTPDHDELTAVTRDVSPGGAALEVEHPLVEGEPIRLSLFLVYEGIEDERTPPLVVGARVRWIADSEEGVHLAGVRFEHITEAQKQWLAGVLRMTQ